MPYPSYSGPYVESVIPDNKSENIEVNTEISVVFSDDIDINTINSKNIIVFGDGEVIAVSLDYDSENRTLLISPNEQLLGGTKYTLRISSDVKNITGDYFESDFISSFTTTDRDSLAVPEMVTPVNQSIINTPKFVWKKSELAEAYHVEIAEDIGFEKLVYSNNFINDYQIIIDSGEDNVGISVDVLDYDTEYFIRVRALDVIYDTVQEEVSIGKENIYYYSDSQRKAVLDKKYWPIESVNSLTVYDEFNNQYQVSSENIEVSSTSASIIFDVGNVNVNNVDIDLNYGITKDNSSWSETVSFYYEKKSEEDYKDLILSSLEDGFSGESEFASPEELINVDLDINEIKFKVYGVQSSEDISVSFTGSSINDIPYIESHGALEVVLSEDTAGDNYVIFSFGVPTLKENNEYRLIITGEDNEEELSFISKISPSLSTIKMIRNSSIGSFIGGVDDKKILYSIYDNSVLAVDIAESADNTIDLENPALEAVKYTTLKTQLDLIYAIYISKTSSKSVQLGDFSVDAFKFSDIKPVLDDLSEKVAYWESILKGSSSSFAKALSVKKSEGTYGLSDRLF